MPTKGSTRAPDCAAASARANPNSFDKRAFGVPDFQAADFALIFFATVIAYVPALRGGMLWDDASHITRSELRSLPGLWRIWFDLGATQQYYPVLHTAFWLEHRMWGDSVLGYHLTNVILHAISACLVAMIVRRLAISGAWLAGLMFALHPVCVESVAWISEQKTTLSGAFCLASALIYLDFDRTRRTLRYWLALGMFLLALMSKTVTATLPGALLVILWWQRGRLDWKRDVVPLLAWLAVGGVAGLFTAWVETTLIGAKGVDFDMPLAHRFLLAGRVIWFYAGELLWPSNLTFIYPRWTIDASERWQYAFPTGVVALVGAFSIIARQRRGPLAGFLIFAGTLFPNLGFLNVYPFRYSYVADHFQYLATLGIIVPATYALAAAARWTPTGKGSAIALSAIPALVLGLLTWRQSGIYRDSETLWRAVLAQDSASWIAHNNLGATLLQAPGRLPEAISHIEAALRINPNYWEAHNDLGNALTQIPGRLPQAIKEYEEALRIRPDYAEAHNNLGTAFLQIRGRLPDAIAQYEAALRISPHHAKAHNNLGNAISRIPGRLPEAIAHLEAALRIKPDYAEAHSNLANAFAQMPGRLPAAIAEYEAALRIRPDLAEAHNNLASVLAQTPGRLADAIAEYEAALRIKPEYASAHNNLGNVLLQMPGRLSDAIAEYETALRIRPDYAEAHSNLGNALLQMPGRLPEAISHLETALRLNPDLAKAHDNLGYALSQIPGRLPEARIRRVN
jgi:tetratricopeptide (TPR) repeat protein